MNIIPPKIYLSNRKDIVDLHQLRSSGINIIISAPPYCWITINGDNYFVFLEELQQFTRFY